MADEEKGPMWVALLAGVLVLGTGPMTLTFLTVLMRSADSGAFEGLARLVTDGGLFSYAVLVAGAISSLIAAVLVGVSVRRVSLSPALGLVAFLVPLLAALIGVWFGAKGVAEALVHVSPRDKATILVVATGELASLSVQALAFAAAGTLSVALASLVSIVAPPKGGRALTALGAGVLGLCLCFMTAQMVSVRDGFSAIGNVNPADRMTLLIAVSEQWQLHSRLSNGLFLASLVIALVGGAALARSNRGAGIATAAALLVSAVGFRGFNALAERQLVIPADATPLAGPALKVIDGVATQRWDPVFLSDAAPTAVDRQIFETFHGRSWNAGGFGLAVTPELTPVMVQRVLQTTHLMKVRPELVGDAPHRELVVPPLFKGALDSMGKPQLAVPLRVLFTDEACEKCVAARLTEKGLEVDGKTWTRGSDFDGYYPDFPGAELSFPGDVDSLVRAGLIALANQHVLVVRVPMPDPMPTLPEEKADD